MQRGLSAPGKLFLAGEYAALWGGVARVLAVGPRAHAVVRRRVDRRIQVLLDVGRLEGDATPLGARWHEPVTAPFHFVARTIDLALRAAGKEGPGFSIAFSPSPLISGQKLGLGSSARAAVLASEAARWALESDFDALKLALTSHAEAQGGKGSGGDVVAAFAGELVRYQRFEVGPLIQAARAGGLSGKLRDSGSVNVSRVTVGGLALAYAFTGTSASTASLIREVERQLNVEQRARFVEQSDGFGSQLEQALVRGDFELARESCAALQSLLDGLAASRSEVMARLLALADTLGATGKQSGAGGGDGAILIAPNAQVRGLLLESLKSRGFFAMPLNVEPGLRGEAAIDQTLSGWVEAAS